MPFRGNVHDEWQRSYDRFHHASTVIEAEHRAIHEGFLFSANRSFTGLADSGDSELLLSVPASTYPHLRRIAISVTDTPVTLTVFEGTTTSDDGTAITTFNRNRNSSRTADATLYHTPTVSSAGTAIATRYFPDAGGFFTSGPSQGDGFSEEFVLKPSTKYLIRLNNGSGGQIAGNFEIMFYELNFDTP